MTTHQSILTTSLLWLYHLDFLYTSIENLDGTTKEVMLLRLTGELSFKEIGELLSKTENWARVTFYRGKAKLGKELRYYD